MRNTFKASLFIGLLSFSGLMAVFTIAQSTYAEEVYKWVDENGITHYGAQPPKNTKVSKIKTRTGHSAPVAYKKAKPADSSTAAQQPGGTPQTAAPEPRKDPKRCAHAKKSLETLKTYARIKVTGDDGEQRVLSEEEHQEKIKKMEKTVSENC